MHFIMLVCELAAVAICLLISYAPFTRLSESAAALRASVAVAVFRSGRIPFGLCASLASPIRSLTLRVSASALRSMP